MPLTESFDRLEQFTVTATANRAQTNPLEVVTRFNPGEVIGVGILIPPGHGGATGISVAVAHQPILPATSGAFIVSDDEKIEWPTEGLPNSGAYSCFVFNTDSIAHVFYVRYFIREIANTRELRAPSVSPLLI